MLPAQLCTPEAPSSLQYLLAWWKEAAAARPWDRDVHITPDGRPIVRARPRLVPFAELQAWSVLTCTALQPWEARVLAQLDRLWLQAWHAGQPAARQRHADPDD